LEELDSIIEEGNIWDNQEKAKRLMQEKSHLQDSMDNCNVIEKKLSDLLELIKLGEEEKEEEIINESIESLKDLSFKANILSTETLLSGEADENSAFVEFHPGAGGTESQDWAEMLMRMYVRWSETKNYSIEIVERALELFGGPVYVRHEVVHNKFVVNKLKNKGAIFVEDIEDIPENGVIIFSAHGVSQNVRNKANEITQTIYDATCPLVTKVHKEVVKNQKQNQTVILIGHQGHPEVEGTLGQSKEGKKIHLVETADDIQGLDFNGKDSLSYTTQTTLSLDDTKIIANALKNRFPDIASPKKDDICYATQNRQDAVKRLMQTSDMLIVLGSKNSSNSNRLKEIALNMKKPSYLVDSADEINPKWFSGVSTVGVTAGASAPELLVQEVVEWLISFGCDEVTEVKGAKESTKFPVPKSLR